MIGWYALAVIALFCYGIQNFLFKVAAEKKCNSAWVSFSFMASVAVFSIIALLALGEDVLSWNALILFSFFNAVTFFASTITRIECLKHISASIALPVIRMSTLIVVIFSVIYFKDSMSYAQAAGILLAIAVVIFLSSPSKKERVQEKNYRLGIMLAIIALAASAATTIVVKFATAKVNPFGFIAVSYIYNTVFSLMLAKKMQTEKENPNHKNAIIIGLFIGILNFIGFYAILMAYAAGPLSLVVSINSLSFAIAVVLSIFIYKEKMNTKRWIGIAGSVAAVILMGL